MAIAVHCPNPGCAKIHQVKDKYAGTRGKCPLCGSWMYVPIPAAAPVAAPPKIAAPVTVPAIDETPAPHVEEPRPAPVPKAAPVVPARRPAPEPEPEAFIVPEVAADEAALLAEEEPTPRPRRRPNPTDYEDEAAVAEASVEEEAEEAKPKPHFSWMGIVLMFMAMLGLGAFAAAPFLPGPGLNPTIADLPKLDGFPAEYVLPVAGAAGGVAFFVLLGLLLSLLTRRVGFLTLFFLYLSVLGSSVLLFGSGYWLEQEIGPKGHVTTLQQTIDQKRQDGKITEAPTITLGYQLYALAGGAGAACLFLILAALFMHKRIWSKLLGFVFLSFWPALAVAWVFRKSLGIDSDFLPLSTFGL